jgi:GNAT superfamily N-acetyltransferase
MIQVLDKSFNNELVDHYKHLSEADLKSRFFYTATDKSIRDYVSNIDYRFTCVYGIFRKLSLIAVTEVVFYESTKVAEISISVHAAHRRLGFGLALMRESIKYATSIGSSHLKITSLPCNTPMLGLALKVGIVISKDNDGPMEGYLKIL